MIYHETFAGAVDAMQLALDAAQAVPLRDGKLGMPHWAEETLARGPVNYGQTLSVDHELMTYKGRQTRAWFHASIYRLESGRYELTTYIL